MSSRIVSAVVLLALGFVIVRIVQPYIQSYQFEELVRREIVNSPRRPVAGAIHRRIVEQGRAMKLIIGEDDVQVERLVRGYQVEVRYAVPLNLALYRPNINFRFVARTAVAELH